MTNVTKKNKNFKEILHLRLEHLKTITRWQEKTFYAVMLFYGVLFLAIINQAKMIIERWGLYVFSGVVALYFLVVFLQLMWAEYKMQKNIDSHYEQLDKELREDKLKEISKLDFIDYFFKR